MKNFNFLSLWGTSLDNGSRMVRDSFEISPIISRKLFTLLFCLFLGFGQMWGANPVATATATSGKSYVIAYWNGTKYIALDPSKIVGKNAGTFAGTDVTVDANGKVTTANPPLWTLIVNPTQSTQFYISCESNNSTYYLYKNGTTSSTNYNIKTVASGQHYWTFSKSSNKYSVQSERGSAAQYLNYYASGSVWQVNGTTTANIILLEVASSCTNSVTITKGTESHGSVTSITTNPVATCSSNAADRRVTITITPNECYSAPSTLTWTKTNGTISVSKQSGPTDNGDGTFSYVYQFAQNDNGAGTFGVTCTAKPAGRTINFDAGAGVCATSSSQEDCLGAGVTLPDVTASGICKGWTTFAGWATSAVSDSTTTSVTLYAAGSTFTPSSNNQTLYAIYSKTKSGNTPSWVLQSSAPSTGDSIMVAYYTGTAYKYMKNSGCDNDVLTVSGSIATPVANGKFKVVNGASNGVSLKSGSNYMHLNSTNLNVTSNQQNSDVSFFSGSSANSFIIKRHSGATTYDRVLKWDSNNWTSSSTMNDACEVYIFKRVSSTTYYCSDPNCCTPLGTIKGAFNVTKEGCTPTQLKATWAMNEATGIASQTLKVYKKGGTWVKDVAIATVPTSSHTETIGGLEPCTEYYVELWSNSAGGNYCGNEKVATSSDVETGSYSVSYTGSTNVNHSNVTTACASADLSITFSAVRVAYVLPGTISVTIGGNAATAGTDYTWTQGTGVLSIAAAKQTGDIVIDVDAVEVGCAADPTVTNEVLGLNGSGTFSLSQVDVTTSGWNTGSNTCEWSDYGFVWGTSANPTVGGSGCETEQVGTSGNATSWNGSLTGTFTAGVTYHYRAYAKNSKTSAAYVYSTTEGTFTPYTISYNKNDDDATGSVTTQVVNTGGSVTLPNASAFTLGCNDLTKWALNSAEGTQYDPEATYSNINANAEFFAIWNTRTYTVQYAAGTTPANGGAITGSHANDTKTCGKDLTLPGVTFYSTGYTQIGWAKSDGGSHSNNLSGKYTSDKEQTFYPEWQINTYEVLKGSKTGCSGNDFNLSAASVNHYGSVTVTASPDASHKGSPIVTIFPESNGSVSGTTISNITGNITVSVSFAAKEAATVKLSIAGSESVVVSDGLEGDSYTLPSVATECPDLGLYGWYKGTYSHATTAPSDDNFKSKGQTVTLTAGENKFYAVYATMSEEYLNTFAEITSESALTSDQYLIGALTGPWCMKTSKKDDTYMNEIGMSSYNNDGTIDYNSNEDIVWVISRDGDNVTIKGNDNNKYLAINNGSLELQDGAYSYTFDYGTTKTDSWSFKSVSASTQQLIYSGWSGFTAGIAQSSDVSLYKRNKQVNVSGPYTTDPNCTTHELSYTNPGTEGTVVLGKSVLGEYKTTTAEATPSAHYTFSHWTISGTGASLKNADEEGKSTDNPVEVTIGTADAIITAHFDEKPKCTVEFYNNGGSALSSTTYWLGEMPEAPELTDGHDHDACDETSDKHYGWTQTAWQQTITKDDVDAKTAANVKVYTKGSALPAIEAGDNGKTIKYYAVWAHAEDNSVQKNYTLSISYSDCPASYDNSLPTKNASEVGGTGTFAVSFGGTGVMNQASQIQFRKSSKGAGYIYNTVDLGSITGITTNNNNISYYIGTSENPSSGTSGGYFKIYNNSDNAQNPSGITVNFTKTVGDIAYSAFLTNCCNQLEDINGAVEFTNPTTAVLTWDKLENVAASNAYAVSYRTGDAAYGTTHVSAVDLTGSKATCTITELSCNTSYDFKIAVTAATGYCDKEQIIEDQNSGKYTITSADGGNPTGGTFATLESACSGDNVGLLAEAATGYNFAGWTITKASSGTVSPAADEESTSFTMPAENVTVSAAFNAISYSISYENMEGATNHANNPASYTVEDAISLGDPTKEGFNFGGWFINSDLAAGHEAGSPAIEAGSTGNKTFYAKWIADDKWSVAITAPSHGTITVSWNDDENSFSEGAQNIDKNTDIIITATPSAGYELTSLKIGDADFVSGHTHKLTSSIVISATFSIINYSITYHLYGGTNSQDNPATFTINDDDIIFDEPTKTGYDFDDWYSNENFEGEAVNGVAHGTHENVDVYAKWTAKESTITWDANGGSVDPTSSSYTYDGDAVELPIPTREHYTFDGWFTAAEGGTQITEIGTTNKPEADVTYHAHWTEITYTVKWSVNADDTYEEGDPTTSVTYNSKVTALPTAPTSAECDDAKKFVGWRAEKITGTSATKPDGIFTDIEHSPKITQDTTFYAVFATETVGRTAMMFMWQVRLIPSMQTSPSPHNG